MTIFVIITLYLIAEVAAFFMGMLMPLAFFALVVIPELIKEIKKR